MPTKIQTVSELIEFPIFDLACLNLKSSRTALQMDELIFNNNFSYATSGGLTKEPGYTRFPSNDSTVSTDVIHGVYDFYQKNGNRYILRIKKSTLQKFNGSSWVDIGALPAEPTKVSFAVLDDLCTIWAKEFVAQKFDGTTLANLDDTPPQGYIAVTWAGRIWVAGVVGSELTVYCSGQNTPIVWTVPVTPIATDPATTTINTQNDNQAITGFMPFFDKLVVTLNDSMSAIQGGGSGASGGVGAAGINPYAIDYDAPLLNFDIGMVNKDACCKVGNEWYFMSFKGVHMLSAIAAASQFAVVKEGYLSALIEPAFINLNKAQLSNSFAVHKRDTNEVLFIVPDGSSTTNNLVLSYDYYHSIVKQKAVWSPWADYPFNCGKEMEVNPNDFQAYYGGYNGLVFKQGGNAHDTKPYTAVARYATNLGYPNLQKTFRYIILFFEEQDHTVTIIPRYDFARNGIPIEVSLAGGGSFILPVILPAILGKQDVVSRLIKINGYGRWLQLEIQSKIKCEATNPVRILGFIIYAEPRRMIV